MPMRARIHGVVALLVVMLVVAACQGAGGAPDARASGGSTTSTSHRNASDMGGMDMRGMDKSGAAAGHPGHDASLPPLVHRLAAATPAERSAATDLLDRTRTAIAPYASEAAARAAGFVPNAPTKRVVHYRNVANRRDDRELDPDHPEGLVYLRDVTGALRLLGALYTVRPGEAAPAVGGDIFF